MKIHLRDLLWLILVLSILGAWWRDHRAQSVWQARAEDLKRFVDRNDHPYYVYWDNGRARIKRHYEPRTD